MQKWTVPLAIIWLLFILLGMRVLSNYAYTPGGAAIVPNQLPAIEGISRQPGVAVLFMFVHPHCPCSRASIAELSVIMARSQDRVTAYVLFLQPRGYTKQWIQTDLWHSAAKIPGVSPLADNEGRHARMFHAVTSGQTVLYNSEGRLLFKGGVTQGRGHEGDNTGRKEIISLLRKGKGTLEPKETPVFGCSLFSNPHKCDHAERACNL